MVENNSQKKPAIDIDWHRYPACGLSRSIEGLTLAFVPIRMFQQHYLPGLPVDGERAARPLTITAGDFTTPLLGPREIARVNAFKSRKRQTEWMAGRLAAKTLARSRTGDVRAASAIGLAYHPEGAPFLEALPDLSLSISHAHGYAVAGLGHSAETTLGLDLEKKQPLDFSILLRTAFSEHERRCLDTDDQDGFFTCWTLKEAYLKYLGRGLRESLKQVEILDGRRIRHCGKIVSGLRVERLRPFRAYTLAIVSGPRPTTLEVST